MEKPSDKWRNGGDHKAKLNSKCMRDRNICEVKSEMWQCIFLFRLAYEYE